MAIIMREVTLKIVNGPSLDALLDSVKYAFKRTHIIVTFTSRGHKKYDAIITGIEYDDFKTALCIKGLIDRFGYGSIETKFSGNYDTRTRTGTISFDTGFITETSKPTANELAECTELATNFDDNRLIEAPADRPKTVSLDKIIAKFDELEQKHAASSASPDHASTETNQHTNESGERSTTPQKKLSWLF